MTTDDDELRWRTLESSDFSRQTDDESSDELSTHLLGEHKLTMHRPPHQDRFGMLRFKVEFSSERFLLRVTIIDAWDLPPMDPDGKADPYVEVSLRPGHKKYTTAIKTNSLNPTFNETAEFPVKLKDLEDKELILKVMDSDFPLQDELIGIIRLPLSALDLSPTSKQYTCLILHEKLKNEKILKSSDGVKFNLKLSEQASQIYDLEVRMKECQDELEMCREQLKTIRAEKIDLEFESFQLKSELSGCNITYSNELIGNVAKSAPTSRRTSPMGSTEIDGALGNALVSRDQSFQLMSTMHKCLAEKSREITQLKNLIEEMSPRLMETGNGLIEIGLCFSHVSSQLRIHILSAQKLKAVNLHGGHSDPFVKVKVFIGEAGAKMKRFKFETKTVWKNLAPVWNEKFVVHDVVDDDLKNTYIEIVVMDKGRLRAAQPLGQVRIGPNHLYDCQHWESMLKAHGDWVEMTHSLRDV